MPSSNSLRQESRARAIDTRLRAWFVDKCYRTDTLQVLSVRWPASYVLVSWTDGPDCEEVEKIVGLGRGKVQLHRYTAFNRDHANCVHCMNLTADVSLRRLY